MKKGGKRSIGRSPGQGKGISGNAGSQQGARRPNRRSIRLPGYDYSQTGAYFVTICTKDREWLFGDIVNREMSLNDAGRMVDKWYGELENKFTDIKCDKYIVMPNHFHAIIQNVGADPVGADLCVCPNGNRVGTTMGENVAGKRVAGENVAGENVAGENVAGENVAGENVAGENVAGENVAGEHIGSPLQGVIQWFKTMTTNEYMRGVKQHGWPPFPGKLWQRNYYEHIIRNENEMARIREYIMNNPAQWATDRENPRGVTSIGK